MTSHDKQIDLLMRRYSQSAPGVSATDHLDADELNAFVEGGLPPAARARYVSHLADCDQCRRQASVVAISSGAAVRVEPSQTDVREGRSWWQSLAGMFALPVLRYAAFGAVILIIAGVAFVALRRPHDTAPLVARNEEVHKQSEGALRPAAAPAQDGAEQRQDNDQTRAPAATPSVVAGSLVRDSKQTEARPAEDTTATKTQPMKEAPATTAPVFAEKKAGEDEIAGAKPAPSYAPLPPAERNNLGYLQQNKQEEAYRAQQKAAGIAGPRLQQRKVDSTDKLAIQERERDAAKDVARLDDGRKATESQAIVTNQPTNTRRADEKLKGGPMRNMETNANASNRAANEMPAEPPKSLNAGAGAGAAKRETTEGAPATRSAGGRKFRRQGNAWVDQKFKSSMSLKNVARGSEDFAALDSGLRSIAQQLGGEVIVVWKGKAYLIK
jgi:hypothetical protein